MMNRSGIWHRARGKAAAALAFAVLAAALGGCRGDTSEAPPRRFFPDLDYQPKYKAQAESRFYRDYTVPEGEPDAGVSYGRVARQPVDGTVPFGRTAAVGRISASSNTGPRELDLDQVRGWMLGSDPAVFKGRNADGSYVERIPIPVTDELIALGRKNWNIYCIVCHGGTAVGGDQAGQVGLRWQYAIPNLHSDQYQPGAGGEQSMDGYIFNIIRNGLRNTGPGLEYRMPPYGHNVDPQEAWAIVSYLRALQLARRADPEGLNEQQKLRLEQQRALAPAPGDTGVADRTTNDTSETNG